MKIAYFSPFPPKQTGIATYSTHLVSALRGLMEVDAYDFHNPSGSDAKTGFADFAPAGRISHLADYATVIYHLGNNPHYHLDIYQTARQFPGIVVLHDVVLYYLFAGLGMPGLAKHFLLNHGIENIKGIDDILRDSVERDILRYRFPEKHPLTKSIFSAARRIVVHNRAAAKLLSGLGYAGPIHVIPLLNYPRKEVAKNEKQKTALRRRFSLPNDDLIIGCFGFLGRTKRLEQICRALGAIKQKQRFVFLIVGEGDDPTDLIAAHGLQDRTVHTRFVSDEDFTDLLALTDILLNLRFPSMGESSATLIQAMSLGKACIVTEDASFAELPADAVVKIRADSNEVARLSQSILELVGAPQQRAALGQRATNYVTSQCGASMVAAALKRVVDAEIVARAQSKIWELSRAPESIERARVLLRERLAARLPEHLQKNAG